ncbi:unnamed protein product, partial [Diplocarpon coronariae]
MSCSC